MEAALASIQTQQVNPLAKYRDDPAGYARDVLGVRWWEVQGEIAESLLKPPYRTLVKASHNVGKTFVAAGIVLWWFDTRPDSIVLTTAPTARQVSDLLWKEIRVQRAGSVQSLSTGHFPGPKMNRLETAPNHFAHGFTARDGDSFQGHHSPSVLIVFDESVGVDRVFWETAHTMFGGEGHAWLCIGNPTDTTSQAYLEETTGGWHVITMSALDHPNIAAELAGQEQPFPAAIRLARLHEMLGEWCMPVAAEEHKATDIEWPPNSGKWLRPGPVAEARLLGRWPSAGTYGVWSDAIWQAAETAQLAIPVDAIPEIGCDVARFGDDFTAIHWRCGPTSLGHESVNGWGTNETAGRLKRLCRELCQWRRETNPDFKALTPEDIPVKIDDDGVGGGVVDQAGDFRFIAVSAAASPHNPEDYPNRRSELWFANAERARSGLLSVAGLPVDTRRRLRQQCMAPTWKLDAQGRRVVEAKDKTKEKLGRSPDDADAMNLAYYGSVWKPPSRVAVPDAKPPLRERESSAERRGIFGR